MARKLPSLNALKAFEAAARHGSFTAAAEELHVSHAAVSRHVRELEAWLNVPLFRRLSRGVRLTDAGERYCRRLTRALDEIQAATREVLVPRAQGTLTVAMEVAFATRWLVPRLGGFQKRYPDVDLVLEPSNELTDFRSDAAEIGVRYGADPEAWEDVDFELLVELVGFPVCNPDLLEGEAEPPGYEILGKHSLLHEETKQWWAEWLEEAGVTGVDAARGPLLQDTHLALEAAAAGQGFALADNLLVADDLAKGRLIKPFDAEWPAGGYYIVKAKGTPESPAAKAFRDWLKVEAAGTGTL